MLENGENKSEEIKDKIGLVTLTPGQFSLISD